MKKSPRYAAAFVILSAVLSASPSTGEQGIQLVLVPQSDFDGLGSEDTLGLLRAAIPGETAAAYLFREGSTSPPIVVPTDKLISLPHAGDWTCLAEAPGWVTTKPIRISVEQESLGVQKKIIWPVVPACKVSLGAPDQWRNISRLDFVSLDHGSVHRLDLEQRTALMVPSGKFLYYAAGTRGLAGISGILGCSQEEEIVLSHPDLPNRDFQDVMIQMLPPEAEEFIELSDLSVQLDSNGGKVRKPAAIVRGARRITAFFPNLPADKNASVQISHPRLLTEDVEVEAIGGTARESSEVSLRLRATLSLDINYTPVRDHALERIEVSRCSRKVQSELRRDACTKQVLETRLLAGLHSYQLGPLDDGKYRVDAVIDDERVYSLGAGVLPKIKDGKVGRQYSQIDLKEYEIFGNILVEGEPTPGQVMLQTHLALDAPRRFPTDDGLEYRLRYYGRRIVQNDPLLQLPNEDSRPLDEKTGVDRAQELIACTHEGQCRSLRPAIIRGGGRLDIEVTAPPRIAYSVTDRVTGEPISDAICTASGYNGKRLVFLNGAADWDADNTTKSQLIIHRLLTNTYGSATLYGAPEDLRGINVSKKGYKTFVLPLEGKDIGEELALEIELEPEELNGKKISLRSSSGEKLTSALVVSLASNQSFGSIDLSCSEVAGPGGTVLMDEECLEGRDLLVLDPRVRLGLLSGDLFLQSDQVQVEGILTRAPILRVVNEEGSPVGGLPIRLVLQDLELSTNDLIFAFSKTGRDWPYSTNQEGRIRLSGVDAQNAFRGKVIIGSGDETMEVDLEGLIPGVEQEVVHSLN